MPRLAIFLALLLFLATVRASRAELKPAEVAVIAARGNAKSEALAEYYAKARGVPAEQICRVDVPADDECPRDAWDAKVRPEVRAWLDEHDPQHKLRCLVTVWGVPLKISAAAPTPELRAYQEYLTGERESRFAIMRAAVKELDAIAPAGAISTDSVGGASGGAATAPKSRPTPAAAGSPEELVELQTQIETKVKAAQDRVNDLRQGADRNAAQTRLQSIVTGAGGAAVLLQNIQQQMTGSLNPDQALVNEFHRIRGAVQAWVEVRQSLERRPPGIQRDAAILEVVNRVGGSLAAISWLDAQSAAVTQNASGASFDSELALALWAPGYELLGPQTNYLAGSFDHSHLRSTYPTLMVSRLDAPTAELARGLVDAAREAERTGLAGKAYFDARGVAGKPTATATSQQIEEFDRAILAAARGMQAETTIDVTVNEEPTLFAPGACPDAALYCGWTSLGKYIDAFKFNRGAIAYHAGGDELSGLHDAASERWCKRLIESGAAATIGAVFDEPGILFPRPNELFHALAQGDQTLAECFWRCQPTTSWSLVLIGDPLYRPFKNRSVAREQPAIRGDGG